MNRRLGHAPISARNPGQFFLNTAKTGSEGETATFVLRIPYPFVTQGANPFHAYDDLTLDENGCLVAGNEIPMQDLSSTYPVVTLVDYSAGDTFVEVTVTVGIPATGVVYLRVHLDYGLKKIGTLLGQDGGQNAVPCAGG